MVVYLPGREETDPKKMIRSLHELGAGRSNAVGTVTLATGAASTVVTTFNGICAPGSVPNLEPASANAAAERASGNLYISSVGLNTFTITHTNSATTGRTFLYSITG